MPCNLLADSIIEISRQLLDRCIFFIEKEMGCRVLYADTDSIFAYTKPYFLARPEIKNKR